MEHINKDTGAIYSEFGNYKFLEDELLNRCFPYDRDIKKSIFSGMIQAEPQVARCVRYLNHTTGTGFTANNLWYQYMPDLKIIPSKNKNGDIFDLFYTILLFDEPIDLVLKKYRNKKVVPKTAEDFL